MSRDRAQLHSPQYEQTSELSEWIPVLAGASMIAFGLSARSKPGTLLAVLGSGILWSGVRRPGEISPMASIDQRQEGFRVQKTITINKSPDYLYHFWRNLENLPGVMKHLVSVRKIDDRYSHWIAQAPAGRTVEWDAEIVIDEPNRRIAWRSVKGADVDNAGNVEFVAGQRGTLVRVALQYRPPAGVLGKAVARVFLQDPYIQITQDLSRLKQLMETGEIARTDGQSSGRREDAIQAGPVVKREELHPSPQIV